MFCSNSKMLIAAAVLCTAAFWEASAAENADTSTCSYFQLPGGKKTMGKNPPNGTPPVITWRRKDFPTGFNIYPGVQDWTAYNALEMELIPDGTTMDFQIRVINQGLVFLYEIISLGEEKTPVRIVLPLKELKVNTKPVDLSKIRMVNFHRDNPPNSPEFELKIRDLKLRKLSDADFQKLREAKAAAAAGAEKRAKAGETCHYFQFPGGAKTTGKNPPSGKPATITWRKKDFPTGFNIYPGVQDWTGYNALEMDLTPDGNAVSFQIRVVNQGLVFLYEIISLTGKEKKHIVLPLSELQVNTKPVDLSRITMVRFCPNGKSASDFEIKISGLKLVRLPAAELKKLTGFRVFKGETGFREMPEQTSLFKVTQERVKKIAALLPEKPAGLVPNYKDRNFWEKEYPECSGFLPFAENTLLKKKLEKIPLDIFPEMLTSPKRDKRGERPGYRAWFYGSVYDCFRILNRMTIAECKENKGRFVPKIVEAMEVLLDMPTWDIDPKTIKTGLRYFESHSAMIAANLALSAYLLDDKLPPELRAKVKERVDEWALTPSFRALSVPDAQQRRALFQGTGHAFWYDVANNMNPYFWNYLVQVALVTLESREHRAWIVANAQEAMKCYFSRYTKEGYVTEGLGYWHMGLSNAVCVDFVIRQATGGKEAVFTGSFPGVNPLALGCRMTMIPGILMWPHFGDHGVDGKPDGMYSGRLMTFMLCDLLAGKPLYGDYIAGQKVSTYGGVMLSQDLANTVSVIELRKKHPGILINPTPEEDKQGYIGRVSPDYKKLMGVPEKAPLTFLVNDQDCGVLISRDVPESKVPFALAIKGGNNGEGHGHDDCGSYCIALKDCLAFGDPGVPVYYHATQKEAMKSYAHPVPYPAGTIQTSGGKGFSKVIAFKDGKDVTSISYDLKNAYAVPSLQKLVRAAVHDRKARKITITDAFEFSQPETFETALTTYDPPEQLSDRVWKIGGTRIEFAAKGGAIEFKQEKLDILMRNYKPVIRLACRFKDKVKSGEISYVITPEETEK